MGESPPHSAASFPPPPHLMSQFLPLDIFLIEFAGFSQNGLRRPTKLRVTHSRSGSSAPFLRALPPRPSWYTRVKVLSGRGPNIFPFHPYLFPVPSIAFIFWFLPVKRGNSPFVKRRQILPRSPIPLTLMIRSIDFHVASVS